MKLILYMLALMISVIGCATPTDDDVPKLAVKLSDKQPVQLASTPSGPSEASSSGRTTTEIYLSLAALVYTLIFGLVIGIVEIRNGGWGANSFQLVGLALVLGIGAFLIPAGYSQEQIAPITGLLGVIIGYLLKKGPD